MPKLTPEQLAKLQGTREHQPAQGASQLAGFTSEIKHLLVDADYGYAEGTLRGILATVERTQVVTPNQRRAVENIAAAPQRAGSERSSRRRRWEE